jgi:hypothetical protein
VTGIVPLGQILLWVHSLSPVISIDHSSIRVRSSLSLTLRNLKTPTGNLVATMAFVMSSGHSVALSIYRVSHGSLTFSELDKKKVEIGIKFLFIFFLYRAKGNRMSFSTLHHCSYLFHFLKSMSVRCFPPSRVHCSSLLRKVLIASLTVLSGVAVISSFITFFSSSVSRVS